MLYFYKYKVFDTFAISSYFFFGILICLPFQCCPLYLDAAVLARSSKVCGIISLHYTSPHYSGLLIPLHDFNSLLCFKMEPLVSSVD
jgi:hypothetical protein